MEQTRKPISQMEIKGIIDNLTRKGKYNEETLRLIKEDLLYGLTKEETEVYANRNLDIRQMRVISKCLRNGYDNSVISIIAGDGLSCYQMEVAFEFYEKGVPLSSIQSIMERNDTPIIMRNAFQTVLEELDKADRLPPDSSTEPDYVKSLMEEIRSVVSKIDYQEKRYDALNEKLKIFESTKKDEEIRDSLVNSIEEKDQMLSEQQDKINQANATIARLRSDIEAKEKEMRKMQTKANELEERIETKDRKIENLNGKLSDQTSNFAYNQVGPMEDLESVRKIGAVENLRTLGNKNHVGEPGDAGETGSAGKKGSTAKTANTGDTGNIGSSTFYANRTGTSPWQSPYMYGIPASCNATIVDARGNVLQTQVVERGEKKTSGVISLFSRILLKKKSRQDIVKLVVNGELIPEQLVQIRFAIKKGLTENQLIELINSKVPAEHMKEIIEIAVLENSMDC